MASPNPENKPITLGILKALWPFIIVLCTLAGMWFTLNAKVGQLQVDLARVETDSLTRDEKLLEAVDEHLADEKASSAADADQYRGIRESLVGIERDIAYLRSEFEAQEHGE